MPSGDLVYRDQQSLSSIIPPCPHRLWTRRDLTLRRKLPIFYSALLLTAVNLLLRLVGTSFQVFLSGRIGAEGIGLLQLTMSVGSMAMVAGMAGIRTATMYLTAEELGRGRPQNVCAVLSGCMLYSILFSLTIGGAVWFFAPTIAEKWIGNVRIVGAIRLFSGFLPVNCMCGVMVGYFTGANRIGTLAVVEVVEQLFNMVLTLLLLTLWAGHDPERSCLCVVAGSGLSACMTLCSLLLLRIREKAPTAPRIPIAGRLINTAVPLALADDLRTGISTVENLMVPRRLALYPGSLTPLAAFGTVTGMVFPVLMFPAALLFGLTELLIPELARCNAAGHHIRIRYLVSKSLRLALLYGTLCGGILFLCAQELCMKLYNNPEAGEYLRWFALLALLLYSDAVTDAVIKGLGEQKASVRYNIITNILDVVFLYFLLPKYGIWGYFVSFLVTHILNFALSIGRLLKITRIRIPIHIPLFTVAAALAAMYVAHFLQRGLSRCFVYITVLGCLMCLLGVISKKDILWIKGLIKQK